MKFIVPLVVPPLMTLSGTGVALSVTKSCEPSFWLTTGFVTNIGGLVTLSVSLPANVGAAYLVQSHLAASIAVVYGHDPHEEEVRTALLLCLLGNGATDVLKRVGVDVGHDGH